MILHCRHFHSWLVDEETQGQISQENSWIFTPRSLESITNYFAIYDSCSLQVPTNCTLRCCKAKSMIWLGLIGKEFIFLFSLIIVSIKCCDLAILLLARRFDPLIKSQPFIAIKFSGLGDIQERCFRRISISQGLYILRKKSISLSFEV